MKAKADEIDAEETKKETEFIKQLEKKNFATRL